MQGRRNKLEKNPPKINAEGEYEGPGKLVSWQSPETESLVGLGVKPHIP